MVLPAGSTAGWWVTVSGSICAEVVDGRVVFLCMMAYAQGGGVWLIFEVFELG